MKGILKTFKTQDPQNESIWTKFSSEEYEQSLEVKLANTRKNSQCLNFTTQNLKNEVYCSTGSDLRKVRFSDEPGASDFDEKTGAVHAKQDTLLLNLSLCQECHGEERRDIIGKAPKKTADDDKHLQPLDFVWTALGEWRDAFTSNELFQSIASPWLNRKT